MATAAKIKLAPVDADWAWQCVMKRDRSQDGKFVTGVLTTGIYCRPSCAARHPKRENVRFFASGAEAREAPSQGRGRPSRGFPAMQPQCGARVASASSSRRGPGSCQVKNAETFTPRGPGFRRDDGFMFDRKRRDAGQPNRP